MQDLFRFRDLAAEVGDICRVMAIEEFAALVDETLFAALERSGRVGVIYDFVMMFASMDLAILQDGRRYDHIKSPCLSVQIFRNELTFFFGDLAAGEGDFRRLFASDESAVAGYESVR